MSLEQLVQLEVSDVDLDLRVLEIRLQEALHTPFSISILCEAREGADRASLDSGAALAKDAIVRIAAPEGDPRELKGVLSEIEEVARGYRIEIVPKMALLADTVDHQVFKDQTTVEIVTAVLDEHGISVESRVSRTLPKRPQCVQTFESDLDFVSRLLSEEGIVWFSPVGARDAIRLVDRASAFEDVEGLDTLRAVETGGLVRPSSVHNARLSRSAVSTKYIVRDYDFTAPQRDMEREAGDGPAVVYEYPAGYTDPSVGADLAKMRLEERKRREITLTGAASSPRIEPGTIVTLADSSRDDMNGKWLIVEATHTGHDQGAGGEARYEARFVAVPADRGYRPERRATPSVGGIQTATVTGPSGAEIHPDSFGRVKALHRWDRRRPKDDTSSAFFRTVQPPTSGGLFLPRVGWEVALGFRGGSGDEPVEIGRLDNGQARPFASLPGNQVVSSFGSLTTPGGGSGNHIAMNDTAGNEGFAINASHDFNEKTENDKVTGVTADETLVVSANRTLIVGKVLKESIEGAQSHSISAGRNVNVGANMSLNSASESVTVGGLRAFTIGGDYQTGCASLSRLVGAAKVEAAIESVGRGVTGASTVMVGAAWDTNAGLESNINVLGASTEEVGALKGIVAGTNYVLKTTGALTQTFASQTIEGGGGVGEDYLLEASYKAGGSMKVKGGDIVFQATTKISITASGITVTLTPGKVDVDGQFKGTPSSAEEGSGSFD
ncbi:MAG: type VI secretion system tip protein TssI/VgrG [Polyangiaceae bacterium]